MMKICKIKKLNNKSILKQIKSLFEQESLIIDDSHFAKKIKIWNHVVVCKEKMVKMFPE